MNEVQELMNKVWQSDQNGSTWKPQLRRDINFCIKSASTYISFRPLDKERFVRGSTKSLGKEYTKERIRERIEMKRERKSVIPKKDYSARRLIDTSDEKFQNSPGLPQWATIENLKHQITVKTEAGKSAKQSVVKLEHRMKDLAEIIKYTEQYKTNRSYHIAYKKSKNPDAYFRRYESLLILYGSARRVLEQTGINLKGLNVDKLKAEYQELTHSYQQPDHDGRPYNHACTPVDNRSRKKQRLAAYIL